MFFQVESHKTFEQAVVDLEAAVKNHNFGVLHIHDLGATLRSKGIEFKDECKIFEVCNPVKAVEVLAIDMRLNMALPCRISVFTENNKTFIGMIEPSEMLGLLSTDEALNKIAKEVEQQLIQMIDEAK
ncbi:hypothetical protein GHNINEIG_02220 [Hydrogenovibrio crunogenus]|uniref:DUF302 domain-containing protein n=1 Tax=Hydrogenovibrio crunogenus TaxID=39765 RepID=A0A4P7P2Q0_9GAMM|nr:DUF302 domain-containing protein [Hydrogenovibrio crunogenus]QBZ84145.1 hypothetical protein GHNINEIG_02220 [Hydrogenovibrio crunogenus]RUM93083.1 MAG: hypothetical protein DSZ27_01155 [Thiomicrospira sp.]